jgi:hypothetical protein
MSDNHDHERRCAQCGKAIPEDADSRKLYCDAKCKRNFHNLSQVRGQEILPLLEAQWRLRYSKADKDPEGYELQKSARQQVASLLSDYLRADRASGRDASLVVQARMDEGVRAMDKRRRAKRKWSAKPWFMEQPKEA